MSIVSFFVRDPVSIHAPVRGATEGELSPQTLDSVSIHAPVRGATHYGVSFCQESNCFNPRAREGRDKTWR